MSEYHRIVGEFDRIIGEAEQVIRDAEYWNGLPHNQKYTPIDVEGDRVLLARLRRDRVEFVAANGGDR